MKIILKTSCFIFMLCFLTGFFWADVTWETVNASIDKKHPSIESLSVEELQQQLNSKHIPVIYDVRKKKEFSISHLPGALHAQDAAQVSVAKDTPIVAYCSVGIRSADFVSELVKRGYTNVKNLRGSIFSWANQGYPLVRDAIPVRKVHPFNKRWGKLLKSELHQYSLDEPHSGN